MKINQKIVVPIVVSILILSFAFSGSVQAATTTKTARVPKSQTTTVTRLKTRANTEIDRRLNALSILLDKVNNVKKVADAQKAILVSNVQNQVSLLTNLKTKIAADTDSTTLKADVKTITQSYRIYALVLPQVHLLTASDSISTTADSLSTLLSRLQARVASSSIPGVELSLSDMQAKIADANALVTAVQVGVSGLVPDNGVKAIALSNKKALTTARDAIKKATEDLKSARSDAQTIRKALNQ